MNYCKIISHVNTQLISQLRLFSAYNFNSNQTINIQSFFIHKEAVLRLQTEKKFKLQNRNVSSNSFTGWHENIYASISNSYPVHFIQDALLYCHDYSNLPWWGTIITSTVIIRMLMTLPLTVYQNYILAKVENISIELKDLMNDLKKETALAKKAYNLSDKHATILFKRSMKKQWHKLIVRDNCHPLKSSLVIWFQIPVWVCMSFALRNLVYTSSGDPLAVITFLELSRDGFGWIPNLTEPDHSYIFPVAFGLSNLAIIEMQRMSKLRQPSKLFYVFTNIFRVFSIVMIPVAANVPSCMCLYWFTSSVCGLAQNFLIVSPSLRRKFKIPESPSELENPYSHMKDEIKYTIQKIIPKK